MKKISTTTRVFLEYTYRGDGKYYLTERGSRHYNHSAFWAWARNNAECFEVTDRGNDAPRGGKIGDYLIVRFTPAFMLKYGFWFAAKEEARKVAEERESRIKAEIAAIGNQEELLRQVFTDRPERLKKVMEAIETRPSNSSRSGDWRSWIRMNAANWISGGRFELLTLSAPDIRDIAYSMN